MNKKEISEIKKQFKLDNNLCSINKIYTCYVTDDKDKKSIKRRNFLALPESELILYLDIFKKTLTGSIGKKLIELSFTQEAEEDGGAQSLLYELNKSAFEDEGLLDVYCNHIVDNFEYTGKYYIVMIHCSYSIPNKGKNTDADGEDSTEVYNFVLTSICPVVKSEMGLCYNAEEESIEKSSNYEWTAINPMHGFLFPVFNDRTSDIHNVLYFANKPKELSSSIIENVLGCKLALSADEQKERFNNLLAKVLGDDSSYNVTSNIHSQIADTIKRNVLETEPVELSAYEIKKILSNSGVDADTLEGFEEVYEEEVGKDVSLTAVNITNEASMKIGSPDVTINVKTAATEMIKAQMVDGRRCLVIALDDNVEVNGLDVSVK